MAITFTEERTTQTYLLWVLVGVVFVTVIILWRGFFAKEPSLAITEEKMIVPKTIDMRWDVLEEGFWSGRSQQAPQAPVSEKQGRDNPFLPSRP